MNGAGATQSAGTMRKGNGGGVVAISRVPMARADWPALALGIGVALALNVLCVAVLWDTVTNPAHPGISGNAAQVLTAAFGGALAVLGAYVGFRAGQHRPPS
jgi:hypothetical protein